MRPGPSSGTLRGCLPLRTLQVQDYAPDAPTALQDEAVIRFAGYLDQVLGNLWGRHVLGGRPVDGILPS